MEPLTQWRDIAGFPNYVISSQGEIRSTVTGRRVHDYVRDGHIVVALIRSYEAVTIPVSALFHKAFGYKSPEK